MFKKILFMPLVLFGLVFFQMAGECFAGASSQLEQAQTYMNNGDYEQAEGIYKTIVQNYPGTDHALEAQKQVTVLYIDWDKQAQAQAALQELVAGFSENEHIAKAVYEVAQKYRWLQKYDKAGEVYQTVVEKWPGNDKYAIASQIGVARSNIEVGNDAGADAAMQKLITQFSDHQDVVSAVYQLAHHCRKLGRHDKTSKYYQVIVDRWPGHEHAIWSQVGVVRANIGLGNNADANAAIEKLLTDFSGDPDIVWAIFNISYQYHQYGRYIVENRPGTKYAMWAQAGVAMSKVEPGNDTAADAAIAKLLADFSGHPDLPLVISWGFAEQYYTKALQLENQGLGKQAREHFQKAAMICEIVINLFPGSGATLEACRWAGDSYRKLGKYEKSIQCYQRVADDYPEYHLAWHALSLVGLNYAKLEGSGLISKSEANAKIKAVYEQLLENYPNCKVAKRAQRWLSQHNSK